MKRNAMLVCVLLLAACGPSGGPHSLAGSQWQFAEVRPGPAYAALLDSLAPPQPPAGGTVLDSAFLAEAALRRNQRELLETKVKRYVLWGMRLHFVAPGLATIAQPDETPDTLDYTPPTLAYRYGSARLARQATALHVRYATPDSLGLALTQLGTPDTLAFYRLLPIH